MNTKSMINNDVKASFDHLFEQLTENDLIDNEARILMFRFLSIVDAKRQELGWSRKDLAEKINKSPAFVSQLFRGDKLINMNTLATIQMVMGFTFEISEKKMYAGKIIPYDSSFKTCPSSIYEEPSQTEKPLASNFPMAV